MAAEDEDRLVVRVPVELREAVDAAAKSAGLDRSKWMREALEAGARRELQQPGNTAATDTRTVGLTVVTPRDLCLHPLYARKHEVFGVRCSLCQTTLRSL